MKGKANIEPANTRFAQVMEVFTWIGIILMLIPGIIYLISGQGFVGTKSVIEYWDKPVSVFWDKAKGMEISSYWFLSSLSKMDSLSLLGIALLISTPLLSIIAAIPKSDKKYKIIFGLLAIELALAIIRPLFR